MLGAVSVAILLSNRLQGVPGDISPRVKKVDDDKKRGKEQ